MIDYLLIEGLSLLKGTSIHAIMADGMVSQSFLSYIINYKKSQPDEITIAGRVGLPSALPWL
jgi:hypothetical protein